MGVCVCVCDCVCARTHARTQACMLWLPPCCRGCVCCQRQGFPVSADCLSPVCQCWSCSWWSSNQEYKTHNNPLITVYDGSLWSYIYISFKSIVRADWQLLLLLFQDVCIRPLQPIWYNLIYLKYGSLYTKYSIVLLIHFHSHKAQSSEEQKDLRLDIKWGNRKE